MPPVAVVDYDGDGFLDLYLYYEVAEQVPGNPPGPVSATKKMEADHERLITPMAGLWTMPCPLKPEQW